MQVTRADLVAGLFLVVGGCNYVASPKFAQDMTTLVAEPWPNKIQMIATWVSLAASAIALRLSGTSPQPSPSTRSTP